MFQSHATRLITLALLLCPVLAPDARAQLLFEDQGVELHGTVRLELSEAGTCNVLESDTAYEEKQANHGAPMDIWRLDFSVRNGSGRWLDHLIARFQIESAWPDCTNWDVPTAYQLPQDIEWAGSIGNIQESGRNVSVARSDADRDAVVHRASRRPGAAVLELVDGLRFCRRSAAAGGRIAGRRPGGHRGAGDRVLAVDRGQHEPGDVRGVSGAVPQRCVPCVGGGSAGGAACPGDRCYWGGWVARTGGRSARCARPAAS